MVDREMFCKIVWRRFQSAAVLRATLETRAETCATVSRTEDQSRFLPLEVSIRCGSANGLSGNDELDATILLTPDRRAVRRYRHRLAQPDR